MSRVRAQFVRLATEEGEQGLLDIGERRLGKGELWDGLPKKQVRAVWDSIYETLADVIERGEHVSEIETDAIRVVRTVAGLLQTYLADAERKATTSLFNAASLLHDNLLLLRGEHGAKVQDQIARVCETWWGRSLSGKEALVPQTISYLVVRSLSDTANGADVIRLFSYREALVLLDFANESSLSIKSLLLHCLINPLFLRSPQGRKFCAFLFGLHPPYIEAIHQTIKNQIPVVRKSMAEAYGAVYLRAWKASEGPYRIRIERDCIQDLMHCAVHASTPALFAAVSRILGRFHESKKVPGIDAMLASCYEPILWRALKVANYVVRQNAATLFVDAFPLQDPSASAVELDASMQKQFGQLQALLADPAISVRVVGVQSVCKLLSVYWEVIPADTVKALVRTLVEDMAHDRAAASVRVAVLDGLRFLLDQRLAHPILKVVLPHLAELIHDKSEKVRLALIALLVAVKRVRAIKFWDVVPVEELLQRMGRDSDKVGLSLAALLQHSYLPLDKGGETQVQRCIVLFRQNPAAALAFYRHVKTHVDVQSMCIFAERLNNALQAALTGPGAASGYNDDLEEQGSGKRQKRRRRDRRGSESDSLSDREAESGSNDNDEADSQLCASDVELVTGLLAVLATVWNAVAPSLKKDRNSALYTQMGAIFSPSTLQLYLGACTESTARIAVLQIARHLPVNDVQPLADDFLPVLLGMERDAPSAEFAPILHCLIGWGLEGDAMAHILGALGNLSQGDAETHSTPSRQRRKRGRRGPSDLDQADVEMTTYFALRCVDHILAHAPSRAILLGTPAYVNPLTTILRAATGAIEAAPATADERRKQELVLSLEIFLRLALHASVTEADGGPPDLHEISSIVAWTDAVVLPRMEEIMAAQDDGTGSQASRGSQGGRKRGGGGEEDAVAELEFLGTVIDTVMCLAVEAVTLGGGNDVPFLEGLTKIILRGLRLSEAALAIATGHAEKLLTQLAHGVATIEPAQKYVNALLTHAPQAVLGSFYPALVEAQEHLEKNESVALVLPLAEAAVRLTAVDKENLGIEYNPASTHLEDLPEISALAIGVASKSHKASFEMWQILALGLGGEHGEAALAIMNVLQDEIARRATAKTKRIDVQLVDAFRKQVLATADPSSPEVTALVENLEKSRASVVVA